MVSEYKIINDNTKKGTTIFETEFLLLIKYAYRSNKSVFCKLKEKYEHLEQKKFNFDLIGVKKFKNE